MPSETTLRAGLGPDWMFEHTYKTVGRDIKDIRSGHPIPNAKITGPRLGRYSSRRKFVADWYILYRHGVVWHRWGNPPADLVWNLIHIVRSKKP